MTLLKHRHTESALPLVLEYIVTLGNGGGSISKCHSVFQYNVDAASDADQSTWIYGRTLISKFFALTLTLGVGRP